MTYDIWQKPPYLNPPSLCLYVCIWHMTYDTYLHLKPTNGYLGSLAIIMTNESVTEQVCVIIIGVVCSICVYMCVYVCICVYMCVYVCICVYMCVCAVWLCLLLWYMTNESVTEQVLTHTHTYIHTYIHTLTNTHTHTHTHSLTHTHIHTRTNTYTYIHTHIYTNTPYT
jgi:hypothetical protein